MLAVFVVFVLALAATGVVSGTTRRDLSSSTGYTTTAVQAALVPPPAAAALPWGCYPKIDLLGKDIRTVNQTVDYLACRQECYKDSTCTFSVRTLDRKCYLKYSLLNGTAGSNSYNPNYVDVLCFVRPNYGGQYQCVAGYDINGDHVGDNTRLCPLFARNSTIQACSDACSQDSRCEFFVRTDGTNCYLKLNPLNGVCGTTNPNVVVDKLCFRASAPPSPPPPSPRPPSPRPPSPRPPSPRPVLPWGCYPNIDLIGKDIRSINQTVDYLACQQECYKEPTCTFSVRTLDRKCYLKYSLLNGTAGTNNYNSSYVDVLCIVRPNYGGQYQCVAGYDINGDHVGDNTRLCPLFARNSTIQACSDACSQDSRCEFFVRTDGTNCYLKLNPLNGVCGTTNPNVVVDKLCFRASAPPSPPPPSPRPPSPRPPSPRPPSPRPVLPWGCYPNIDLIGKDIRSINQTVDYLACQQECYKEPTCTFSVRTLDRKCYLKYSLLNGTAGTNNYNSSYVDVLCIVRPNYGGQYQCVAGYDINGDHVGDNTRLCPLFARNSTIQACSDACSQDSRCEFFVRTDGTNCYLKLNPLNGVCGTTNPNVVVDKLCFRASAPPSPPPDTTCPSVPGFDVTPNVDFMGRDLAGPIYNPDVDCKSRWNCYYFVLVTSAITDSGYFPSINMGWTKSSRTDTITRPGMCAY
ncbi:hypothetical protein Vretifemale_20100, partial [Volvox reticuliferus]